MKSSLTRGMARACRHELAPDRRGDRGPHRTAGYPPPASMASPRRGGPLFALGVDERDQRGSTAVDVVVVWPSGRVAGSAQYGRTIPQLPGGLSAQMVYLTAQEGAEGGCNHDA